MLKKILNAMPSFRSKPISGNKTQPSDDQQSEPDPAQKPPEPQPEPIPAKPPKLTARQQIIERIAKERLKERLKAARHDAEIRSKVFRLNPIARAVKQAIYQRY